jgi:hypothetical protein
VNNYDNNLLENDKFLNNESRAGLQITSGVIKLFVDIYIYWNLSNSIKHIYREFQKNYTAIEGNRKSIMASKRWLAFISLIFLLSLFDTIGIAVTRMIPNKYAETKYSECVPEWAIFKTVILEVFNPNVKFL